MKKISIIVTVYNKEPFVRRCLDSIYRQMNNDIQVIVIDDGSTDKSKKIVDEYKEKGFEIYHTKNKGVSSARNFGLKKVKGEFITFLDADDAYREGAIDILLAFTEKNLPIIQFGQYRWIDEKNLQKIDKPISKFFSIEKLPRRWQMVWNKLYRADIIEDLNFCEGLSFGEDELFNIKALFRAKELKHAPQALIDHYFDDANSLCRGGLNRERLEEFIQALGNFTLVVPNEDYRKWIFELIKKHENSELFRRYGYGRKEMGKYDIVYCLKETPRNEELRYSLRSVEENLKYRNVVFYGGCPVDLEPDRSVRIAQTEPTKWERVRNLLMNICNDEELTDDFWLFNDDFYILKPMSEYMKPQYNGTLYSHVIHIEARHNNRPTIYTQRLRYLIKTLEDNDLDCLNYAVHKPILYNKEKLKEVLMRFPDEPMIRALYGNYWKIGGEDKRDMKVQLTDYKHLDRVKEKWEFLSSSDRSFNNGNVGVFIRERFNQKSRFEK